jgi:hypothetical protein
VYLFGAALNYEQGPILHMERRAVVRRRLASVMVTMAVPLARDNGATEVFHEESRFRMNQVNSCERSSRRLKIADDDRLVIFKPVSTKG